MKNFFVEHPEVEAMTPDEINSIRKELKIYVKGELVPNPIKRFDQLLEKIVDPRIIQKLRAQDITEPTPIQS